MQDQLVVRDGRLVFRNEFYQLSFRSAGVLRTVPGHEAGREHEDTCVSTAIAGKLYDRRDHVGGLPSYSGELHVLSTESYLALDRSTSVRAVPGQVFRLLLDN